MVSPPGATRKIAGFSEPVTYIVPSSANTGEFGSSIGRSGAPFVYVSTSPVAGSTRTTSARCQSHAYTRPNASTAMPSTLPPVFATSVDLAVERDGVDLPALAAAVDALGERVPAERLGMLERARELAEHVRGNSGSVGYVRLDASHASRPVCIASFTPSTSRVISKKPICSS